MKRSPDEVDDAFDLIAEAMRRELCRDGEPEAADPSLAGSSGELFVLLAQKP